MIVLGITFLLVVVGSAYALGYHVACYSLEKSIRRDLVRKFRLDQRRGRQTQAKIER